MVILLYEVDKTNIFYICSIFTRRWPMKTYSHSLSCLLYVTRRQQHPERLSENLVACSVDEWIDTEIDVAKCSEYVEPFPRQPFLLFTNPNSPYSGVFRISRGISSRLRLEGRSGVWFWRADPVI